MLDFLTKNKTRVVYSDKKELAHNDSNEQIKMHHKLSDNFIRKNNFNGRNIFQYSVSCLSKIAKDKEISQGAFFVTDEKDGKKVIKFLSGFASPEPEEMRDILEIGEGFPGQVAKDGKLINISDIPAGYLTITSGLGKAEPVSLILFPVKHENNVLGVIELASFQKFTEEDEKYFEEISPSIAEQIMKCKSKAW